VSVAAFGQRRYPMVCHGGGRLNAEIFAGVIIVHFEPTDVGGRRGTSIPKCSEAAKSRLERSAEFWPRWTKPKEPRSGRFLGFSGQACRGAAQAARPRAAFSGFRGRLPEQLVPVGRGTAGLSGPIRLCEKLRIRHGQVSLVGNKAAGHLLLHERNVILHFVAKRIDRDYDHD
jgi:hypothetical protein